MNHLLTQSLFTLTSLLPIHLLSIWRRGVMGLFLRIHFHSHADTILASVMSHTLLPCLFAHIHCHHSIQMCAVERNAKAAMLALHSHSLMRQSRSKRSEIRALHTLSHSAQETPSHEERMVSACEWKWSGKNNGGNECVQRDTETTCDS